MKVSLKWLSKLVDITNLTPEEIAHKLTFAGMEVESINYLSTAKGLVIGKVLECEKIPDTHLHLTQIDLGDKYRVQQIICGAPNIRQGLNVVVAPVGCKLPMINIVSTTIRGYESNGMVCSYEELGVDTRLLDEEAKQGIIELAPEAEIGNENVLEYLGLDDVILDISLLANRSDLLAMENVAKEIQTLFGRNLIAHAVSEVEEIEKKFEVKINTEKCSQFSARVICDVDVKTSSEYIQKCLTSNGIKPINNIVDIGNYVMLLTGQPIHMYDLDKMNKKQLVVRDDLDTKFTALNEFEYEVKENDICICYGDKIGCLGGVMGSLDVLIDGNTKNIIVEVANFNGAAVRRTSNRLDLISDSSIRFVKGINPNQVEYVQNLVASLIKEDCEKSVIGSINNIERESYKQLEIPFSVEKINAILGTDLAEKTIVETLEKVHIEVINNNGLVAKIPSQRIDIHRENDLAEEVIRLIGFDGIKSTLPQANVTLGELTINQKRTKLVKEYLINSGLDMLHTYVLINQKESASFNILVNNEPYSLINPLSEDRSIVRTSLMPSLLEVAKYNFAHQNRSYSFFEVSDIDAIEYASRHLGVVLLGEQNEWGNIEKKPYDFYHIKGLFEGIMATLNIQSTRYTLERLNIEQLHPGKCAGVYIGKKLIGYFGELHPSLVKEYGFNKTSVVVMELDLNSFVDMNTSATKFKKISKFPKVEKDYAFIMNDNVASKDVIRTIKAAGKTLVEDIYVFDIYKGQPLNNCEKSLAITVVYSDPTHTLKEEEILSCEGEILKALEKSNIKLRN